MLVHISRTLLLYFKILLLFVLQNPNKITNPSSTMPESANRTPPMRHSRTVPISPRVVIGGLRELPESVRHVMEQSITLYLQRRMMADDLMGLLRSFAWQSPTLTAHFAAYDRELEELEEVENQEKPAEPELLSEEDMRLLAAR